MAEEQALHNDSNKVYINHLDRNIAYNSDMVATCSPFPKVSINSLSRFFKRAEIKDRQNRRSKFLDGLENVVNPSASPVVQTLEVCDGFFNDNEVAVCAACYGEILLSKINNYCFFSLRKNKCEIEQGNSILYGTKSGIYLQDKLSRIPPKLVLKLKNVTQIEVLEKYSLLIALSGMFLCL